MKKLIYFLILCGFGLMLSACGEEEEFNITKHQHDLGEWIDEVLPTCGEDGVRGHYYCATCDAYFNDMYEEITSLKIKPRGEHKLDKITKIDATCTEVGTIDHFKCRVCNKTFVYSDEPVVLSVGGSEVFSLSNWGGDPVYLEGEGTNAYVKLVGSGYPIWTQLDKALSSNLVQDGQYTIKFDVKLSEEAYKGINPNGYKGSIHLRLNYQGTDGEHYISKENGSLGECNMDTWTTLSFDYELSGLSEKTWLSLSIIYWLEGELINNYILIDNIRIIAKGDTKEVNLDTTLGGDIEGLVDYFEVSTIEIPMLEHDYKWVIDKTATLESSGIKHQECEVCGSKANLDTIIEKIDCLHENVKYLEETKATCINTGKEACYYCSDCNNYFEDSALENKILDFDAWGVIELSKTHNLEVVEAKAATETEDGYIKHLNCVDCDSDFIIDNQVIELPGFSQWLQYPIGNFTDQKAYIETDSVNTYLKLVPIEWWPKTTGITKDTGSLLTKAGTYVLKFDIKGSDLIDSVKKGKLDIHFNYNGGNIKLIDGVHNLSKVSNDEWITMEYEFSITDDLNSNWSNFVFYYWPEDSVVNNYLLLDNIEIYAKNDVNKTNLDEYGMGDFEGFIPLIPLTLEDKIIKYN